MGSYAITLVTSSDTDTLFPIFVAKYNAKNGTNLTVAQYASNICNDAVAKKTQDIMNQMGV